MVNYLFYGITIILFLMFILTLVKKPKFLNRFEAIWVYVLLYFWIVCGLALLKYPMIPVLTAIFSGIAGFLLWFIILVILRRPKFDHRGAIIATCLIALIVYLTLFFIISNDSGMIDIIKEILHK